MSAGKIFQVLPVVMAGIGAIAKNGNNTHQNYRFRSIDDMYNKIQPVLAENKLFFVPQLLESKEEIFDNGNGKRSIRVSAKVKYTIYADDGSSIESVTQGEAIDTSDKATNKALTAAFKYMLIQVFCIAITNQDDADKISPPIGAKAPPPKPSIPSVFNDDNLGEYVCNVGRKYKGKKLKDIDSFELNNFLTWLKNSAGNDAKGLGKSTQAFLDTAEAYLKSLEFHNEEFPA